MGTLSPSAIEFLELCHMQYEDGSGHSLENLSPSEINNASSDPVAECADNAAEPAVEAAPSCSKILEQSGARLGIERERIPRELTDSKDSSVVLETPESVVLETPPEECTPPQAQSTPRPCDDTVGFRIYPEEVPASLAAATIKMAKKYFLK
ncbi:hypothetical protein GCK32_006526 [Trichostrongylus colubriformis]|uniref:Uncharacterized protein n=1 Tax=Trichostrongylus colubriformis TaxID=6319 RepID=A0AAN8IPD6_TRICO